MRLARRARTLGLPRPIPVESLAIGRGESGPKIRITVPSVVIAEWWRAQSDVREALAAVRGATAIDAIVMASAAQRGDVVCTSDVADLQRLGLGLSLQSRILTPNMQG